MNGTVSVLNSPEQTRLIGEKANQVNQAGETKEQRMLVRDDIHFDLND